MIELQHVSMDYGNNLVLDNVNFTIHKGDFVAITGPNGGGKTTMLRLILKLLKPSKGQVYYCDEDLKFGYLPQKNAIDSQFPVTVEEVVTMGLKMPALHRMNSEERALVDATITRVGLEDVRHHTIGALSGGQLQRTLLGRAIIGNPSVLVLDEPLSYIDKQFEQRLYDIIEELSATATIILVSHEMSTISSMANRHIIVNGGVHECHAHHHFIPAECR